MISCVASSEGYTNIWLCNEVVWIYIYTKKEKDICIPPDDHKLYNVSGAKKKSQSLEYLGCRAINAYQ